MIRETNKVKLWEVLSHGLQTEGPYKTANTQLASANCPRQPPPEQLSLFSYDHALYQRWHGPRLTAQTQRWRFFSYLEKFVITLGRHQEASILKLHLPVLQQVVQNRQNIPLRLFQAFQDECPTFCSCTNCTLFPRDKSNRRPSNIVERGLILLVE